MADAAVAIPDDAPALDSSMSTPLDKMTSQALSKFAAQSDKELSAIDEVGKQRRAEVSKQSGDYEKDRLKLSGELDKLQDDNEKADKEFQAPKQEDPAKFFGSVAGALAMLASFATKTPLTTSLNAFAAGMNAIKSNNKEQYDQAFEQWKANTDFAQKQLAFENEHYKDAFELMKTDMDAGKLKLENLANDLNDEAMKTAILGKVADAESLAQYRERSLKSLSAASEKVEDRNLAMQIFASTHDGRLTPQTPQEAVEFGQVMQSLQGKTQGGNLTDDATEVAAREYLTTGQMPALGLGASGTRTAILNRAGMLAKERGISGEDLAAIQSGVRSDRASLTNITRIADSAESYENTALKNMDIVKQKMPAGIGTNLGPWVDRWVQSGRTEFGDKDVPPYVTALVTVANEYAKVMSGSTGAQGSTVDSRKEAAELLNKAQTSDQVLGVMDVMRQDMENKKASYRGQRAAIGQRIEGATAPTTQTAPTSGVIDFNSLPQH